MIVLAIICLLVAALIVVLMLSVGFAPPITFTTAIGNVTTRPFWVFLLGAATLLIAMMGLSLLRTGTRRKVHRRREIKQLRKVAKETQTTPASGTASGTTTTGRGGHGPDDAPDRTLVREQRSDARTQPGTTSTGSVGDDTQPGSRQHNP